MSEPTTIRRPSPTAQPPAPPSTDVAAPPSKHLSVEVADGETISAAQLLRLLDQVRQDLARDLVGSPGAFVGYDSLTVARHAVQGPGKVMVEARLTSRSDRLHDVDYVAVSVPPSMDRQPENGPLLVRGTGRTLHVGC